MPNIARIKFDGDVNLGLHSVTTEDFCIVNSRLSGGCYDRIKEVLGVRVVKTLMANSGLVGIFSEGNSNGVVVPKNAEKPEKETLEKGDVNYGTVDSKQTALGNLILVNDEACMISERLDSAREKLEEVFDVPVETGTIAGLDLVGTTATVTNRGMLCHRDATDEELEKLESLFGLECGRGTVNFGSPFVGAMLSVNSEGVLAGERTTGPEMGRIEEALFQRD